MDEVFAVFFEQLRGPRFNSHGYLRRRSRSRALTHVQNGDE